jgi:alpha-glucosidase
VQRVIDEFDPLDAWPTWVLSNHDNPRHRTRYGSEARARAAAVLLLTLRGTPFLYEGEELGLEDAVVPPAQVVDPGGRDGCRAPVPWSVAPPHGWTGATPWLPFPPDAGARSVEALTADPASILHLYRRVLAARHASPALEQGTLALLPASGDAPTVLGYTRADHTGDDRRLVFVNFGAERATPLGAADAMAWDVEVSSTGIGEGGAFDGALAPDSAVILRPRR